MPALDGQVALVTGASRGVGRGVAQGLAHAGAKVFATGRTIAHAGLDAEITGITCDHTDDLAVADVFRRIEEETGRLDVLVNAAWDGYERMVEDGRFTFIAPFWEQWQKRTESVLAAGVFDLSNSESPEFIGRAIAALTMDPQVTRRSGIVLVAAALAVEYGFSDADGRQPRPLTLADV